MRHYAISLAVGLLAGVIYGLMGVRSPAPPVVALVGLLGMLCGEKLVPIATGLVPGERQEQKITTDRERGSGAASDESEPS